MKKPSDLERRDQLRNKIIGLGEKSIRKSYYPELQQRILELEKTNTLLLKEIEVRREAEKNKERLEEQLRQSMKMEAIGTLAGGIAHDFNNILTAIIGYTDLARLSVVNNCSRSQCPAQSDLDQVLDASHRAKELVKQILTFSRQEKHQRTPVQLSSIVKEALKLLRSTIPASVQIRDRIITGEEYIMAVPTQIHQIVMNLVTNGYHAMRKLGGILAVNLYQIQLDADDIKVSNLHLSPGPYLVLEVSDTGIGMSRTVMERIFDPYYTTKGDSGGTGMGLAVVHGIVREHKGHISVYSEPAKGSTFKVYFPQIIASAHKHVTQHQERIPGGTESIMLVDDEKIVLDLEKAILNQLGYKVAAFLEADEALEAFYDSPSGFDLIITDMTMPKMNGAEFTRRVLNRYPEMPVIICTGFSELLNEEKARAIGAREFVMKPLVMREIASTLRTVLD